MIGRLWLPQRLRRFLREERGNAAVVFAFVLLPLLAGTGLAIDSMLAFTVEERLQKSLDAAGLAAGQTSVRENIEPDARAFFNSNFGEAPDLATVTGPNVVVSPDGTEITLTASATMPTRFMHLFGQDSVTVNARSVISRQTTGLELALVLDVTGSMVNDNKIGGLKTAANELLNILYSGRETVPNLWVGIVPYTGMVNIGTANQSFLHASDPVNISPTDFAPDGWGGCVLARPSPRDQNDDPPSVARFASFLHPDRPGPIYPSVHQNDWGSGRSPSTRKYTQTYHGVTYWEGWGPNFLCPDPVTPLVAEKSRLVSAINDLRTWERSKGATHTNVGLAWGWRVISPRWRGLWNGSPANLPLAYQTPNMLKFIVVLTDGDNTMNVLTGGDGSLVAPYTAYESHANLGVSTGNANSASNAAVAELNSRTRAVCSAIRAQGITIYAITFGPSPSAQGQGLMRNCASQPTSTYYFHSPDNAALRNAFRAIGSQLSNLRIKR
jgi:Flp pilus assembly protein TadG